MAYFPLGGGPAEVAARQEAERNKTMMLDQLLAGAKGSKEINDLISGKLASDVVSPEDLASASGRTIGRARDTALQRGREGQAVRKGELSGERLRSWEDSIRGGAMSSLVDARQQARLRAAGVNDASSRAWTSSAQQNEMMKNRFKELLAQAYGRFSTYTGGFGGGGGGGGPSKARNPGKERKERERKAREAARAAAKGRLDEQQRERDQRKRDYEKKKADRKKKWAEIHAKRKAASGPRGGGAPVPHGERMQEDFGYSSDYDAEIAAGVRNPDGSLRQPAQVQPPASPWEGYDFGLATSPHIQGPSEAPGQYADIWGDRQTSPYFAPGQYADIWGDRQTSPYFTQEQYDDIYGDRKTTPYLPDWKNALYGSPETAYPNSEQDTDIFGRPFNTYMPQPGDRTAQPQPPDPMQYADIYGDRQTSPHFDYGQAQQQLGPVPSLFDQQLDAPYGQSSWTPPTTQQPPDPTGQSANTSHWKNYDFGLGQQAQSPASQAGASVGDAAQAMAASVPPQPQQPAEQMYSFTNKRTGQTTQMNARDAALFGATMARRMRGGGVSTGGGR